MNNRPGCISGLGVVVAAVALVGLVIGVVLTGAGMFSPGGLNAQAKTGKLGGVSSHAQITSGCGACHTAPWSSQTMADRCLACHADVQAELQAKNGLHGKLLGESPTSPTCRGCHPEHGGPNGALTAVNEATFPHGMTGYSLTSHQKKRDGHAFVCADCHPTRLSQFDQAVCADCHRGLDAAFMSRHEATFGQDCLPCHDGSGKNGADFDHSKLPFKLTGKHAGVACEKCHTNARSLSELQKTPQTCFACHQFKDKHAGKFGQDCGQCHTTATWANAKFDHTIFPVDHGSREMIATCATCHPQGTSTYTCYGCHAHTPANVLGEHEGKQPSELQDCVRCHEGGKGGG